MLLDATNERTHCFVGINWMGTLHLAPKEPVRSACCQGTGKRRGIQSGDFHIQNCRDLSRQRLSRCIYLVGGYVSTFYILYSGWWWLEPWNFMTFHILGISSSQLTFIFVRGVGIPPTRLQMEVSFAGKTSERSAMITTKTPLMSPIRTASDVYSTYCFYIWL